jgi:hypothetical protein
MWSPWLESLFSTALAITDLPTPINIKRT